MHEYKIPGARQRPVKVVDFEAAFEIVGCLKCPAGERIAAYNAQSGLARAVADPMLMEELLVTREVQRHLEATDPNAPLRVMGRAAEAAHAKHASGSISDRVKERVAFRPAREKNQKENGRLVRDLRAVGLGGHYNQLVQGAANYAAAGIVDTTALKRKRGISEKESLADRFTVAQIGVRTTFQAVMKEHAAAFEAGKMTAAEFEQKIEEVKNLLGDSASKAGVHFSENRPFVSTNQRLKLPEEKVAVKRLTTTTVENELTVTLPEIVSDRPEFVPISFQLDGSLADQGVILTLAYLKHLGFVDAKATKKHSCTRDGGVDIAGSGIAVQVKVNLSSKTSTGRPEISQLVGDTTDDTVYRGCARLFFSGHYSAEAVEKANNTNVALFLYNNQGQVSTGNVLAQELCTAQFRKGLAEMRVLRNRQRSNAVRELSKKV